jgi:hypothetical protein
MKRANYPSGIARRQEKRKSDLQGLSIIGLCAAVLIAVGALAATQFSHPKIDQKTGCPVVHSPPTAHTIILIDETDELPRDELAFAKALILNEYYWLPEGGRLTVRNIISDPELAEDIVVCRMSDGSGDLGLTKNPKKLHQDFERIAGKRLGDLFTDLRTAAPQRKSPILEFISESFDRPNFGANVKQRRLVVLSDMVQFSSALNQYGRRKKGKLTASAALELRREMAGVAVRIQYVRRPKLASIQTEMHRAFWTDYLKGQGAAVALGHSLLLGEEPTRETWDDGS